LYSTCCLFTSYFYFNAHKKQSERNIVYLYFSICLNPFTDPEFLKEQYSHLLGSDTMPENEKSIPMTAASGNGIYHHELLN